MENEQISDLAKAVLANERITPSTGTSQSSISSATGRPIPKGATPVFEGACIIKHGADSYPAGANTTRFSLEDKEEGN